MDYKKIIRVIAILVIAYFVGYGLAMASHTEKSSETTNQPVEQGIDHESNWGLGFGKDGQPPTGNATPDELKQKDTYYIGDTSKKVIYLTFDAGYENGNTEPILEALKKHNAHGTFFVVGNYIKTSPELVKKMVAEGHTVGNHTLTHPNMSKISTMEAFKKEIGELENMYKECTGKDMIKFYRPPQGKYSEENLKMAQELGYKTFFWSLAYVDWYQDKQPSKEQAFDKLLKRIHPGAIVLLHSTSKTNGQILDELLTKWEEMGYTFGNLEDLVK
ncbi:MAG: polysaccharide deacetylase family protein [bacterium]|nr:polysaccharide deacetylase family protein [bacterium]